MYCSQCGTKVSEQDSFCQNCGSRLGVDPLGPDPAIASSEGLNKPSARQAPPRNAWWKGLGRWTVRIVGILLVAIIYGVWRGISSEMGLESALMGMIRGGLMGLAVYGLWRVTGEGR